jgi:micrococcal nuclease
MHRRATLPLRLALRCWLVAAALLFPGGAASASDDLTEIVAVIDGGTVALADGRQVRLSGILAPAPPLGGAPGTVWRRAEQAKSALGELAIGRRVALREAGDATDRYGRIRAQLYRDDGLWLQGEMLRRGLARVAGRVDDRGLVPEMLRIEAAARAARRGLWSDPAYAIRRPEEAGRFVESFELVEGTVVEGDKVKGQIFLNLGPDWHSAFAIHVPRTAAALFKAEGLDPLSLKGRTVRVRGWIRYDRRPLIDVLYPEAIELPDR